MCWRLRLWDKTVRKFAELPIGSRTICTLDYSYPGLFVPSTDYSYLGLFVPWTVRTLLDCSYRGLFVPSWTVRTMDYSCRPWTFRTLDFSYPGLFVPWTVRTFLDCSYHGLFVPSLYDSYHVEKGNIVYTVWVKKNPPWGFLTFFPKWLRIFSPNFTGLLYVHTYGRLHIFIQLSPILTNLYHIKCDHPARVSADGGHFEHMIVVALNMAQLCQCCR